MKVVLLSDIHGNYDALEAVLADAEESDYKEIWTLGDLGGYGPEGDTCFHRLMAEGALLIPGNHDYYYAGKIKSELFTDEALKALLTAGQKLSSPYRELMKTLPDWASRKGCTLVHGSLTDPIRHYILSLEEAQENFNLLKGSVLLFGHTHKQGCFVQEYDQIFWSKGEEEQTLSWKKKRILINPGSVGQPRDGDPRASWAILDLRKKEVQFKRTSYDIPSYQKKMRELGATEFLINRVEKGY